jgi:hypothetical protein
VQKVVKFIDTKRANCYSNNMLTQKGRIMIHYIVKMTEDAVGFYVVQVVNGIEMYIKGTSHSKLEMMELAHKLNEQVEAAE